MLENKTFRVPIIYMLNPYKLFVKVLVSRKRVSGRNSGEVVVLWCATLVFPQERTKVQNYLRNITLTKVSITQV